MKIRNLLIAVVAVATVAALAFSSKQQAAESEARAEANAVAAALRQHQSRTGAYPATLGEAGFDAQALRDRWSLAYRLTDGKPALFYSAQNMPLVAHHYNFESQVWEEQH